MAIDLTPQQKTELTVAWPFVGPYIQGTLKSLEQTFANHPEEIFTGADVATVIKLGRQQIEDDVLGREETNATEE